MGLEGRVQETGAPALALHCVVVGEERSIKLSTRIRSVVSYVPCSFPYVSVDQPQVAVSM